MQTPEAIGWYSANSKALHGWKAQSSLTNPLKPLEYTIIFSPFVRESPCSPLKLAFIAALLTVLNILFSVDHTCAEQEK